jgi:hypothetical protein
MTAGIFIWILFAPLFGFYLIPSHPFGIFI